MGTPSRGEGGYSFLSVILDQIDDSELLAALETPYMTGRPSYPLRALWRAKLSQHVLNIPFVVDLVERLRVSWEFREVCGFGDTAPSESTFSRFTRRLTRYERLVVDCLNSLTAALKEHIPSLGETVAIDSTAIEAWANPNRKTIRDVNAKWGVKHSARSSSKDGTEFFFGYKAHVLADADHGIPLGFIFTPGNTNDGKMFRPVLDKTIEELPWLKPSFVVADRGYDTVKNHRDSVDRGMVPIIHIRDLRSKKSSQIYDPVAGAPTCLGKTAMEYVHTDPATGHHLFQCKKGGCSLKDKSNGAWQYCDDEVWEDPYDNLRVVGIVARQSDEWWEHYAKRQAIERLFRSTKHSRLMNTHRYMSMDKVGLHTTLSLLTWQATALAQIKIDGAVKIGTTGKANFRQMRVGASTAELSMAA